MMFSNGIITQVGTTVVAVAIMITYVQPKFAEIGEVQDNIATYKEEREKIKDVNDQLAALISKKNNNVSLDDEKRLFAYLPEKLDSVSIQRDLTLITEEAGIEFATAISDGASVNSEGKKSEFGLSYGFKLNFESSYAQLKEFLILLEQNDYPLFIKDLSVKPLEGGFLTTDIEIETYTYNEFAESDEEDGE